MVHPVDTRMGVRAGQLGRAGAGSELAVDAFLIAVADLAGGVVVAIVDLRDLLTAGGLHHRSVDRGSGHRVIGVQLHRRRCHGIRYGDGLTSEAGDGVVGWLSAASRWVVSWSRSRRTVVIGRNAST